MKNIETIISEIGVSVTEEQMTALSKAVNENYKTIAEVEKKDAKIQTLTEKVKATEETLKTFEGIDADGMKTQIESLQKSLAEKDAEYNKKLADRDFNDLLKQSIADHKGKNATAIISLLDVETLKASNNQKEDIASAIKSLTEADDSSFLFDTIQAEGETTKVNPIGAIGKKVTVNYLDDKYKGNPYYHPHN